jgi:aquaporin Z
MFKALRSHWPEYLMEGAELGTLMVLASIYATALFAPISPVPTWLPSPFWRGAIMGICMGMTVIALIYSLWGKRSGAHMNPSVTLAFYFLGKYTAADALFYALAQFVGGTIGIALAAQLLGEAFTGLPVNYIVTRPGIWGWLGAVITEAVLAFSLMTMVLVVSNHRQLHHITGVLAGILVATFITFAAPISGMSINPSRSFASNFSAHLWTAFWIYYFVPPLAMLLAAGLYRQISGRRSRDICGKLCPNTETRCICTTCPCMEDPNRL